MLKILFYTASFGIDYYDITSDWCSAIKSKIISNWSNETGKIGHIVLSDLKSIKNCNVNFINLHQKNGVINKRQIGIKLLKMYELPYESQYYMWLDVDVRPVNTNEFIKYISDKFYLNNNEIALTYTLKKNKYNGGLFIYSGRACIDYWKDLIIANISTDIRGRDQPYLIKIFNSNKCKVFNLPEKMQGYYRSLFLNPFEINKYWFIHYTGNTKKILQHYI